MIDTLKLWPITVTHPRTMETVSFLGQGKTVLEAVTDGAKNCSEAFRPDQSGAAHKPGEKGGPTRVAVKQPDGTVVFKSMREFEADPKPAQPEGETLEFA